MKIRVLGAGFYGCSIAIGLIADGHDVQVHEIADRIFAGASGAIPARVHLGFHYSRSRMTRAACAEHNEAFMARYGFLTRGIPVNIYAIARDYSLVDFDQYVRTLTGEVEFIKIYDPAEFGVYNVEGAILTGERHIVVDEARKYFAEKLSGHVICGISPGLVDNPNWDLTVDATFCANDAAGVDRYEPCLVPILEGPVETSVTIMDGPFHSLYVWDPVRKLSSLSSAKFTPLSKSCKTWAEARHVLDGLSGSDITWQTDSMVDAMRYFYPWIRDYRVVDHKLSIRAMPLSGADTRLVDVVRVGERALRVRAGKIDAVIHAEKVIKEMINGLH